MRGDKRGKTAQELEQEYGPNWWAQLGIMPRLAVKNKPVITLFEEFPETTQQIYRQIAAAVWVATQRQFELWAAGSRVNGTWRTVEEENEWAQKTGKMPKHSDYDYVTTGVIPTPKQLDAAGLSGIKTDGIHVAALEKALAIRSRVVRVPVTFW